MILAPLSELYGRQPVLTAANWFYLGNVVRLSSSDDILNGHGTLAFNTGCGFAKTPAQFYIFSFLAGVGGSAPLSIGGGVLADLWPPGKLGKATATFTLGPLLGPAIGPIIGAWIAQKTTWRWVVSRSPPWLAERYLNYCSFGRLRSYVSWYKLLAPCIFVKVCVVYHVDLYDIRGLTFLLFSICPGPPRAQNESDQEDHGS